MNFYSNFYESESPAYEKKLNKKLNKQDSTIIRRVKSSAAIFGIITMSIMGLVGFYANTLPDFYYVSSNEPLTVNSVFEISSKQSIEKIQAANSLEGRIKLNINGSTTTFTKIQDNTLMLFGSIPIKEVQTGQIARPKLTPCGQPFGIKLMTDGVMVIDIQKINNKCPAIECGIRIGDIITSVNGETVMTNKKIGEIISGTKGKPCTIIYKRDGDEKTATLTPVYSEGSYKAGMWVRDSSAGIGTLTFYDSTTGAFGGLGHPICDSDTKIALPLSKGTVGEVTITGVSRSEKGNPGQLIGEFTSSDSVGEITANNDSGVFGKLNFSPSNTKEIELGFRQEAHTGEATIYTTINGEEPKEYKISIEKLDLSDRAEHDMIIKVTDPELLEKAGGIVQGMSGSPIIQDGRLIGAVTHVFIEDPTQGYGIFADSMYQQATAQSEKTTLELAG